MNQSVIIINIRPLYEILNEINNNFSYKLVHFNDKEFDENFNKEDKQFDNSIFLTTNEYIQTLEKIRIKKEKILLINISPESIYKLIDRINVCLIQNKYDFQSNIKLKNYNLDINSKTIEYKNKKLKLTEKEIEIILFLNKDNLPKKVIDLQKNVWGYSNDIETHTVETHVYRLRKKISDTFKDDKFILSDDNGYFL